MEHICYVGKMSVSGYRDRRFLDTVIDGFWIQRSTVSGYRYRRFLDTEIDSFRIQRSTVQTPTSVCCVFEQDA